MNLYIKHMVSQRCKIAVELALETLGVDYFEVGLGVVRLVNGITDNQILALIDLLQESGLQLKDNDTKIFTRKVEVLIFNMLRDKSLLHKQSFSAYLSEKMKIPYRRIAHVFCSDKGVSIEQYIIQCKIQMVKDLMILNGLKLTEISNILDYSSVAHLSRQFKKETGYSPADFKRVRSECEFSS